jgi:putative acetyltransferase
MELVIAPDDPRAPDVRELLEKHLAFMHEMSPPEHVHALDVDRLVDPAVTFFSARKKGILLGVGALNHLDATHVEIKSMHTALAARRQGVARAMLDHLLAIAVSAGFERVSLETGTMEGFAAARALYQQAGFRLCPPYGRYTVNPYSVCMTMSLSALHG